MLYTWRYNEVLKIFAEAAKICWEIASKALNNITYKAIHFVKEGNILKLSRKNKHNSSLLDGYTDWHIATDLEHHFLFPTEIVLMTQRPDIVIWFIKLKVFIIELMVIFEENFDWAHQRKLEKYEDLQEQCVRNGWITNVFPIKVGCWGFITNSTCTIPIIYIYIYIYIYLFLLWKLNVSWIWFYC